MTRKLRNFSHGLIDDLPDRGVGQALAILCTL